MINNLQIYELSHVIIPVMLLPHDFRAYSNIKVDNHMFNKLVRLFVYKFRINNLFKLFIQRKYAVTL